MVLGNLSNHKNVTAGQISSIGIIFSCMYPLNVFILIHLCYHQV